MKKLVRFSVIILLLGIGTKSFGQELLSDLIVMDMLQDDSTYSFAHIEFNCVDVSVLSKVEVSYYNELQEQVGVQELKVVHEAANAFLILMNQEKIEIRDNFFSFMTPLDKPGKVPYSSLTVRGMLNNNNYTNSLSYTRQINE